MWASLSDWVLYAQKGENMNKIKIFWANLSKERQLKVIAGVGVVGVGLKMIAEAVLVKNG